MARRRPNRPRLRLRRGRFLRTSAALTVASSLPISAALADSPFGLGCDVLLDGGWHALGSRGVGIITNQSGVTSQGDSIVDALLARTNVKIKALFAPEHGLRGYRPAG